MIPPAVRQGRNMRVGQCLVNIGGPHANSVNRQHQSRKPAQARSQKPYSTENFAGPRKKDHLSRVRNDWRHDGQKGVGVAQVQYAERNIYCGHQKPEDSAAPLDALRRHRRIDPSHEFTSIIGRASLSKQRGCSRRTASMRTFNRHRPLRPNGKRLAQSIRAQCGMGALQQTLSAAKGMFARWRQLIS